MDAALQRTMTWKPGLTKTPVSFKASYVRLRAKFLATAVLAIFFETMAAKPFPKTGFGVLRVFGVLTRTFRVKKGE